MILHWSDLKIKCILSKVLPILEKYRRRKPTVHFVCRSSLMGKLAININKFAYYSYPITALLFDKTNIMISWLPSLFWRGTNQMNRAYWLFHDYILVGLPNGNQPWISDDGQTHYRNFSDLSMAELDLPELCHKSPRSSDCTKYIPVRNERQLCNGDCYT